MKQSKSRKSRETTAFLYERLSRDDDKSKVHKAESFFVRHQRTVSVFLFKRPNEFVVNCDDLFFTFAIAAHTRSFINCDTVNQFVEHKSVQFLKAGVFLDELGKAVNIRLCIPHLFQCPPGICNRGLERRFFIGPLAKLSKAVKITDTND